MIWPYLYAPEIIPLNLIKSKRRIYVVSMMFVVAYSSLSYAGALFIQNIIISSIAFLFGVLLLIMRRFIKI
jgi:hypothetical protein